MIGRIYTSKSFRATVGDVLEKSGAKIIGGNMYGDDVESLTLEFMVSRNLAPSVKSPCYHLVLSELPLDKSDKQLAEIAERHFAGVIVLSRLKRDLSRADVENKLSDEELNKLIDEFIDDGLAAYDYFVARSGAVEVEEVDIVVSRINFINGVAIATWKHWEYVERSLQLLERCQKY